LPDSAALQQSEWPEETQALQLRREFKTARKELERGLETIRDLVEELRPVGLASKEVLATRDAVKQSVAGLFDPGNAGKLNELREMHADLRDSLLALHKNTGGYIKQELESYAAAQRVKSIDEEAIHRIVGKVEGLIAEHKLWLTGEFEGARKEWRERAKDQILAMLTDSLGDAVVLDKLSRFIAHNLSRLPDLRRTLVTYMQNQLSNEIRQYIQDEVQRRLPRDTEVTNGSS